MMDDLDSEIKGNAERVQVRETLHRTAGPQDSVTIQEETHQSVAETEMDAQAEIDDVSMGVCKDNVREKENSDRVHKISLDLEPRLRYKKTKEENFIFDASVCSTWIPSVVGDPHERIFLKASE